MSRVEIIPGFFVGRGAPLFFVAGPCVLENESHFEMVGTALKEICDQLDLPFVLKTSFDKANRSSADSFRGPGMDEGLRIIERVKNNLGVPLLLDIHHLEQAEPVAQIADVLQIPAFLCRQTDLLQAAARTGKPVNVKKGQFLSPWEARNIVDKVEMAGNDRVLLTERGSSFGYNNLVVDIRALPIMRSMGTPVIFDATHSLQLPGAQGSSTGGMREYIPHLARAAVAAGVDGLYMEVHDDPDSAPCDGPNMWPLKDLKSLLLQVMALGSLVRVNKWIS